MVLYKRKPVLYLKPPEIGVDKSREVFLIEATGEWFNTYEEYLERMDYYNRRKFVCEITGNSCLSFFQALKSEQKEIKAVEKNFPETLREHILKYIQFSRISRLDQVVDTVYSAFKNEFFPGETVFIKGSAMNDGTDTSTKYKGTVKEKIQYSNPLETKYLVVRQSDGKQAIVTHELIFRDRNHYTKWLIKTFIKLTMSRSHKVGAPWVVKTKYAKKYRIPEEYPDDLIHFKSTTPNGEVRYENNLSTAHSGDPSIINGQSKDAILQGKNSKKKNQPSQSVSKKKNASVLQTDLAKGNDFKNKYSLHHLPETIASEFMKDNDKATPQPSNHPTRRNVVEDTELRFNLQYPSVNFKKLALPKNALYWGQQEEDGSKKKEDHGETADVSDRIPDSFKIQTHLVSVQEALECWMFFNMYHEVLKLDTFTFDDFLYAMAWNYDQFKGIGRCVLLDEIWCAALGAIVSNETKTSKQNEIPGLIISLPPKTSFLKNSDDSKDTATEDALEGPQVEFDENEAENNILQNGDSIGRDESAENESKTGNDHVSADNENEIKSETEALSDNEEGVDSDSLREEGNVKNDKEHDAYSVMNYRGIPWYDRLCKRNYKDGNWQCILLGVLSLVEYIPYYNEIIQLVFKILAPSSMALTPSTVLTQFYKYFNIEMRLRTLRILVELLTNGLVIRKYIEECLDYSTTLRRNRLDNIRDYKITLDSIHKLSSEINDYVAEFSEEEKQSKKGKPKINGTSKHSENAKSSEQTSSTNDNKKRPKIDLQAFEMGNKERKLADTDKGFKKLWAERANLVQKVANFKKEKRDIETKLNEIDCQRVKLLGKDRLYNRYWWFENNGLPNLHLKINDEDADELDQEDIGNNESEVTNETYLMGRLWVQGASNEDIKLHLHSSIEQTHSFLENASFDENELEEYRNSQNNPVLDTVNGKTLRKINFAKLPGAFRQAAKDDLSIEFTDVGINNAANGRVIIDQYGGLSDVKLLKEITPLQRKVIEESPEPLLNGNCWRYYDDPHTIEQLIERLNPWGIRESQLKKEMLNLKDIMKATMTARRNALALDVEDSLLSKLESSNEANLEKAVIDNDEEASPYESRGRRKTSPRLEKLKRQKIGKYAFKEIKTETESESPSASTWHENDRELLRVLEWVNSKALDMYDKSLYEGGDRIRGRGRPPKS